MTFGQVVTEGEKANLIEKTKSRGLNSAPQSLASGRNPIIPAIIAKIRRFRALRASGGGPAEIALLSALLGFRRDL